PPEAREVGVPKAANPKPHRLPDRPELGRGEDFPFVRGPVPVDDEDFAARTDEGPTARVGRAMKGVRRTEAFDQEGRGQGNRVDRSRRLSCSVTGKLATASRRSSAVRSWKCLWT